MTETILAIAILFSLVVLGGLISIGNERQRKAIDRITELNEGIRPLLVHAFHPGSDGGCGDQERPGGLFERPATGRFQLWCRPRSFTPAPTPNRTCKFPSIRLSR